MTNEEIDVLVAEKVMGWHKGIYVSELDGHVYTSTSESWLDADGHYMCGIGRYPEYDSENLHTIDWHPSESILWAWEIVEKLHIAVLSPSCWYASGEYKNIDSYSAEAGGYSAFADTAPLAICRVALLVVEEE